MTNDEGATAGRIVDRPVADLFQWLHDSRGTGIARFRTALGTATVWIRDGELVDADMGRFHLDAAVLRLLRIQDGDYEIEWKPVHKRRAIKASTPVLLAEARQRAPRMGTPKLPAPAAPAPAPAPVPAAVPAARAKVDSGAHTLLDMKAVARPPAKPTNETRARSPASDTDAQTVVGARAPVAQTPIATPVRGPAARRRGLGWSPTSGGQGQAPEPTPSARSATTVPGRPSVEPVRRSRAEPDALDDDDVPTRGRTRFMFGVSDPAVSGGEEPEPAPAPATVPPAAMPPAAMPPAAMPPAAVPPTARAPRFGAGAPTADPVPPHDAGSPSGSRRRRPRAATRPQIPFEPQVPLEPEPTDRTLLRAGPIPPPPGQPMGLPKKPPSASPVPTPTPHVEPLDSDPTFRQSVGNPAATQLGYDSTAPEPIDEEYSHSISVPTDPNVGPGGTWMLSGPSASAKPLPPDPTAEDTVSMLSPDVLRPRAPSLSGHVKAGGTAHVGRYEVLLRLARGEMGTLYLCRVTGEGGFRRLFALEVIRDHLNANQGYVQMLLEEARIASRLSHPNIVSIIDIDTFAGQHFLVMDYVEGCTLSALLEAHPMERPPALVIPIFIDALTGLHAAHMLRGDDGSPQPVVHGDFSPQNMLVGINGTCSITGFGIARAADVLGAGPGRGKPGHVSPEQVRGLPLDPRSDVFSAGVVLWNALTGQQLFAGETPQQILHQVVSRPIPKPSTVGLRPPACFDRICLRALERDPSQRYQSAELMLMELRKVAIAEDLLAPSSEVGHWVQETFGAQLELRRQTAGLGPGPAAAVPPRDAAGPLGAAEAQLAGSELDDSSPTGSEGNASMTMMLRSDPLAGEALDEREGVGPRTRVVVLVAALTFMATAVVTLLVRPELLQGGLLDEHGRYVDPNEPPPELPLHVGTTGGAEPVSARDETTGSPLPAGDTTGGEPSEAETDEEPPPERPADPKGKPGRGKTTPPAADGDGKAPKGKGGKGGKGKGKGKGKGGKGKDTGGGATQPPPDLNELFRPPGG